MKPVKQSSFCTLLSKKYLLTTIIIWVNWFTMMFVYNGMVFMIPFTLSKMGQGKKVDINISSLYLPVLFEAPSYVVSYFMLDWKSFGRKKTAVVGYFMASFFLMMTIIFKDNYFILMTSFTRFFITVTFMTVV